jgi:Zn-finger nucleic acid-binding protein
MDCPRCRKPLHSQRSGETEIDTCAECGGLFLDRGELNRIAPTGGDLEYSTLHGETFHHADCFPPADCPRCDGTTMVPVEFIVHTKIILDHCRSCEGFWLDGRELERIRDEVRELDEESEGVEAPPMTWFARFLWSLPR